MDEPPVVVRDWQIVPHEPCVTIPLATACASGVAGAHVFSCVSYHVRVHFVFMFTLSHRLFRFSFENTRQSQRLQYSTPPRVLTDFVPYAQGGTSTCGLGGTLHAAASGTGGLDFRERALSQRLQNLSTRINFPALLRGSTAPLKAGRSVQYYGAKSPAARSCTAHVPSMRSRASASCWSVRSLASSGAAAMARCSHRVATAKGVGEVP